VARTHIAGTSELNSLLPIRGQSGPGLSAPALIVAATLSSSGCEWTSAIIADGSMSVDAKPAQSESTSRQAGLLYNHQLV
jgi:hypothetical protein